MAYMKLLLVVALIAGVDHALAQFAGTGAFAGAGAGGYGGGYGAGGLFGGNFPFGGYSNLPQLPQLPFFGGMNFPAIRVPSPADIASMSSGPNSHGIMTVSNMATEVGPDGEVKRTGGTTIVTNDGQDEKVIQFGDQPPTVTSNTRAAQYGRMPKIEIPEIKIPKFPKMKMPKIKMPKFPKINMPAFPDIEIPDIPDIVIPDIPDIEIPDIPDIVIPDMPDIDIPDIPEIKIPKMPDTEKMKNYVPFEGENFVSMSSITQSHTSDLNGKKKNGGRVEIYINNNGKIHSEAFNFGDDGANSEDGEDGKVEDDGRAEEDSKVEQNGENEKDGKDKREEVDQENEIPIGDEENHVRELGDMDKYEIV